MKNHKELPPNLVTVLHLDAGNLVADHFQNHHPLFWRQGYVPMTETVATLGLGLRVERCAEFVAAAAAVENRRSRNLRSEFGFACFCKEALKLGGECGEHIRDEIVVVFPVAHITYGIAAES